MVLWSAIAFVASTSMASQFISTGIDRCSTNDHKGQYENISLKLNSTDKTKLLFVGVTFEGYVDVLTGEVVSRIESTSKAGVSVVTMTAKLEDQSIITSVESGDTEAKAQRNNQKFECGD